MPTPCRRVARFVGVVLLLPSAAASARFGTGFAKGGAPSQAAEKAAREAVAAAGGQAGALLFVHSYPDKGATAAIGRAVARASGMKTVVGAYRRPDRMRGFGPIAGGKINLEPTPAVGVLAIGRSIDVQVKVVDLPPHRKDSESEEEAEEYEAKGRQLAAALAKGKALLVVGAMPSPHHAYFLDGLQSVYGKAFCVLGCGLDRDSVLYADGAERTGAAVGMMFGGDLRVAVASAWGGQWSSNTRDWNRRALALLRRALGGAQPQLILLTWSYERPRHFEVTLAEVGELRPAAVFGMHGTAGEFGRLEPDMRTEARARRTVFAAFYKESARQSKDSDDGEKE